MHATKTRLNETILDNIVDRSQLNEISLLVQAESEFIHCSCNIVNDKNAKYSKKLRGSRPRSLILRRNDERDHTYKEPPACSSANVGRLFAILNFDLHRVLLQTFREIFVITHASAERCWRRLNIVS